MFLGEKAANSLFFTASVVGLVVVALIFGGLVHKRIGISSVKKVAKEDVADNTLTLDDLQKDLGRVESFYKRSAAASSRMQQLEQTTKSLLQATKTKLANAKEQIPMIQAEIHRIEGEFSVYRNKVREISWVEAIGEYHPMLTTLDGKTYHEVTLSSVHANGIHISHKNGLSQISSNQLGLPWHERLHWSKNP
jgi:hypothetical protein